MKTENTSAPSAEAAGSAPITDAHRMDALERLLLNCPHAELTYDEENARYVLSVEGCERTEYVGDNLRAVLDQEVIYQREWEAGNICDRCCEEPCRCAQNSVLNKPRSDKCPAKEPKP